MKKIGILCAALMAAAVFSGCSKAKADAGIKNIADLAGKKIGVQAGTTGESWVQDNVEGVKLSSFKSGIDAALDLKTGALDCVVLDELPAESIVAKNPDLKIIRCDEFAANKEEYAIAVRKGFPGTLEVINETIKEMKANGDYEALVNAYMPADGNIVIPSFKSTGNDGVIKLGTNAAFPPFEYVEGKDYVGFDISMGEKIAQKANRQLQVVDMAFDSLIPALQAGTIDFIAAGMSVTEERKKNVDFSEPYFSSEQVIIVSR